MDFSITLLRRIQFEAVVVCLSIVRCKFVRFYFRLTVKERIYEQVAGFEPMMENTPYR